MNVKKEVKSVDVSLKREQNNYRYNYGDKKYGAELKRKAIQRLPYLEIHPICSCKTQTLLHIWLSPEALCQNLENTETNAHTQLLS